jgi:hypothetical protein
MPWFKVDDTFAMHEKVMAAGNAAIGLWTRAGAWSMQQLTDGFVPDHVLRALGTPKERRTLVEVSLWVEVEGGVEFKNWNERQPTKEQVETARQAAAERQRHARERAKSRRESQRDSRGSSLAVTVPPTRPDPTRPVVPTELPPSEGADKPPGARKRAATLPKDWQLTEQHRAIATERGVDLDLEATKFRDWAAANGATKKDWDATFRNWLRNAKSYGSGRQPGPRADEPSWRPESIPACPSAVAESPQRYAQWIADWSAGKPVPVDGGGTAQRKARA